MIHLSTSTSYSTKSNYPQAKIEEKAKLNDHKQAKKFEYSYPKVYLFIFKYYLKGFTISYSINTTNFKIIRPTIMQLGLFFVCAFDRQINKIQFIIKLTISTQMSAGLIAKKSGLSHIQQKASFYIDQVPSQPSQYIFDELYKSKKNKRKFSKDRNYSYFNNVLKIKNKYESSGYIYSRIFARPAKSSQKDNTQDFGQTNSFHRSLEITGSPAPKYRIQMLNSQTYKIYRPVVRKQFDFQPQNSPLNSKNTDRISKLSVQKKLPQKQIQGVTGVSFHFCIQRPKTTGNNRRQKIERSLKDYIQANHQGTSATLPAKTCQRHMRKQSAPQPRLKIIHSYNPYAREITRRPIHSRVCTNDKYNLQ